MIAHGLVLRHRPSPRDTWGQTRPSALTHLAIAYGLIAAAKGWKARFTSAADLIIALEAAHRQGRVKEVMHRLVV